MLLRVHAVRTVFLCAFLLAGTTANTLSQDLNSPLPDGAIILPEIIVEARKRRDDPQDVPFGLSIVTGDDLEARGARRVQDVVQNVPGLSSVGFGDGRSTNFHIRGIGSLRDPLSPDDTNVVVYVDGVPQPLFAADAAFLDIERIEVLKGPQGTLFGRNASAGVINITTRKPTDEKTISATAEVGEQGHIVSEVVTSGPVLDSKLSGRLAIRYRDVDGFVPNTLGGPDVGERAVIAGRGTLQYTPTHETGITLSMSTDNDKRTFPFMLLQNEPRYPITSSFRANTSTRHINSGALSIEHDLGEANFTSITGIVHLDTDDVYLDDSEGLIFSRLTGLPESFFAADDTFTDWAEERLTISQEFRLNSKSDNPRTDVIWVAGLAYYRSDFKADYFNRNAGFAALNGHRDNELKTNSYAAFGEVSIPFATHWTATLGGRATHENKTYDSMFRGIGVPGTVGQFRDRGTLDYDFLTGRASLSYRLSEETVAFATLSRGHKTGGFPRLAVDGAFGKATAPYNEATSWAYELGVKYRATNNRGGLDVTAYRTDVKDEHVLVFDAANFSFLPSNVNVLSQGFELEGQIALSSELHLSGGLSYTKAEIRDVSQLLHAVAGAREGNRPTNIPEFTSSVSLNYEDGFDIGIEGVNARAFANLSWNYIGDRPADIANSFLLDSYSIINARLGLTLNERTKLYAFARNMLDVNPELAGASIAPGAESVIPGRGRILGVGMMSTW